MKGVYRECSIESYRDQAMGGWSQVYWSAYSSEGFEIACGFDGGTVREMYNFMKEQVDEFLDECKGSEELWEER